MDSFIHHYRWVVLRILVLMVTAAATDPAGAQTIWRIMNPSPPWDDYQGVHFINDQEGWAVGANGHVIRTENGGEHWYYLGPVFSTPLTSVQFLDSNTGWIGAKNIYKTGDGGYTWTNIFNSQQAYFYSMFFFDELNGYVGNGSGHIYRTQDGGATWNFLYDKEGGIKDMVFLDQSKGWVLGWYDLLKTLDGGSTWEVIDMSATLGHFNDFQFISPDTGWLVTSSGFVLHTDNAMISWDTLAEASQFPELVAVHFFNLLNGRIFTGEKCFITLDGGETWEEAGGDEMYNSAIHFPDGNFGCATGERLQYTNDGGMNWEKADVGHTYDQYALCLGSGEQIYTGSWQKKIMYSDDNGNSWTEQELPDPEPITGLFCKENDVVWACGKNGSLWYTNDSGATWIDKQSGTNNDLSAISFSDSDHGMAVGWSVILMTDNGGSSWQLTSPPTTEQLSDVHCLNDSLAWACGDHGYIIRTADGGVSWEEITLNQDEFLYSIHFVSPNRGWVTTRSKIYSTHDGGVTWAAEIQSISGFSSDDVLDIAFQDSMNGWAVGEDGLLLHTNDGGEHWVVHDAVVKDDLHTVAFRDLDIGLIAGEQGNVLYTEQGSYLAPALLSQSGNKIVCEGENLALSVEALGDSLQYQWLLGSQKIIGATDSLLLLDSISVVQGGLYSCRITNGAGFIYSDKIMVSIKPLARITGHPVDQVAHESDTAVFNLAVTGALPIFYRWQKNGEDIPDAIYNIYPIYSVQLSDSGYYRCIVSNDCATDTTDEARLTVLPASAIQDEQQPPFRIIPNPTRGSCRVEFGELLDGVYTVYNIRGEALQSGKIENVSSILLDTGGLLPGIHYLRVSSPSGTSTIKFIKI